MPRTSDINVAEFRPLPRPADLLSAQPKTDRQAALVEGSRRAIRRIVHGQDRRLLAIVGPCSIHDPGSAGEYAARLARLARELDDRLLIVLRAYFEKPRTSSGWKGLLLDPHLDGTGDIAQGLWLSREFLRQALDLGLPTATEFLDPISPQYLADLVCWAAIGARTAESQTHRQLASGLSMPLGFKNSTCGSIRNAVNAIRSAAQTHTFLGISPDGYAAAVHTRGNPDCHLVLRGGAAGPNYEAPHVAMAEALLNESAVPRSIMVDCSHDNSRRHPQRQPEILRHVIAQLHAGSCSLIGFMLESNLAGGSQSLAAGRDHLRYGVSITDGCLDWDTTERCLRETHAALAPRFALPTAVAAATIPAGME